MFRRCLRWMLPLVLTLTALLTPLTPGVEAKKPSPNSVLFFASDGRFSRTGRFESTPALERADATDESGAARLALDPTIEATAQGRTYVVEATVVGADDQTVTATRSIAALPPFLVGLKVPRYLERAAPFRAEALALGPDDEPVAGRLGLGQ